ncbi:unnamed protein product (mitochondrion) [Plasmodiophora brassicae]|uniref:glutamate synthase (NADH) n=1 Tax=Plasmodiophora brassicae TaxID=37360 RepID=A0A3P3YFR3_PLABS|nr:unnamed protein product [Plasmodiophora brassicae]
MGGGVDDDDDWFVGCGLPAAAGLYDPALDRDSCGLAFVVDLTGVATRKTVDDALTILSRLEHRGACGCDEDAGDGAGILLSIPHEFFRRQAERLRIDLPERGRYAVGNVFLPRRHESRSRCIERCCEIASESDLDIVWWRDVPTDNSSIGKMPRSAEPATLQVFMTCRSGDIDRQMFLFRKRVQNAFGEHSPVYICSLSTKIVVYKGQLTPKQLPNYYADLRDPELCANMAMVHSRFSTNTFPSWERAQPLRTMCHNGEINTLRGNINWMRAREGVMQGGLFGADLAELYPVVEADVSDSGAFDNVLEFLHIAGQRELHETVTMMVPEAWQNDVNMPVDKRAMYEYHSGFMEPWDGPAVIAFTNGDIVGAVLDRNGLRPGRYYITSDQRVVCASEVGVVDVADELILSKGRLEPGRMFLIDMKAGVVVDDADVKARMASRFPYQHWLDRQRLSLDSVDVPERQLLLTQMKSLGYTSEITDMLLLPMAKSGYEALGSMGTDVPLAVLSRNPKLPYDYFKQLFAQVTNPPIDPIRERIIFSLTCPIGPEGNILASDCENGARRLSIGSPILTPRNMAALRLLPNGWSSRVVDITIPVENVSGSALESALLSVCRNAELAANEGAQIVILSDASLSEARMAISPVLCVGAVHHYLIRRHLRSRVAIVVDAGDCCQVHHFCVLIGFGADAIYPRVAYSAVLHKVKDAPMATTVAQYQKSINNGIAKVIAKMGVSTLQGYKGAQLLEAIGIHKSVMDVCFCGAPSRIGGVGFDVLARDAAQLHTSAFADPAPLLEFPGEYHWRQTPNAEVHINHPDAIAALQRAARTNDRAAFDKFTSIANRLVEQVTLRGQLQLRDPGSAIELDQVESAASIVRRFCTGAMSFGSISREAHTSLAKAMNAIGGKSNTGEGGEESDRYGNDMRSAIKQVASGRFGVTIEYLANADEIQIKMAQGAKPGEGGELPGHKVFDQIAATRRSTVGVGLISPPPHHDIYSIEDLAQLIYDLKHANPKARISVKLVSEVGVGVVAAGVVKGKADHILISGHDGGTGASRWTGIKHAGAPWELGLAETHQTLVRNGLRSRVVLQTDGQLRTGLDVVKAAMLGAEEFGFATAPLIVLGCLMMRKCHLNTCPVGIATQDPVLRAKFAGQPEHVINYMFLVAEDVRRIMAGLRIAAFGDLVGRTDLLEVKPSLSEWIKTRDLDLSLLLARVDDAHADLLTVNRNTTSQRHVMSSLDQSMIPQTLHALASDQPVAFHHHISNTDRAVGTNVSFIVTTTSSKRTRGEGGGSRLPEGFVRIHVRGSAGQSFGAFLAEGVTLQLVGDANDYVGKGLSGGCISVQPSPSCTFDPALNTIVGNVVLYGATGGKAFFAGQAASRFLVRNSGAKCVVEGAGDHACEYMTGGTAIILGPVGRNFAAGMSGGLAFVYTAGDAQRQRLFAHCNQKTVDLGPVVDDEDKAAVHDLVDEHFRRTGSALAARLLSDWAESIACFVKVFPTEYRKALLAKKKRGDANNGVEGVAAEPVLHVEECIPKRNGEREPDARAVSVKSPDRQRGFLKYRRATSVEYRSSTTRVGDFREIFQANVDTTKLETQAARCMDCGVPFCHQQTSGCPLGNRIPEFNGQVVAGQWRSALETLLSTNNFPEFTGRVCPAPCEGACVLGVIDEPVTIKNVEMAIVDKGFAAGWIKARPPRSRSGFRVAVIGSGPAGLAVADQLNRVHGHTVHVYERADRCGGLLMYGVPNMKLDKRQVVDRRLTLMVDEGVVFHCNELVTSTRLSELTAGHDAVVLATGATVPRNLPVPGRDLKGIHFAMEYLTFSSKSLLDGTPCDAHHPLHAAGRRVLVIGGGDTGNDCIGTAMRQGAKSVINFELMPEPPASRSPDNPWPEWPRVFRVDYGHAEAQAAFGEDPRQYCVLTKSFIADPAGTAVAGVETVRVKWSRSGADWRFEPIPGTEKVFKVDLVLIAMGFVGPETDIVHGIPIQTNARGNFQTDDGRYMTSQPGVFACGDCRRGQSLVVWAISEGRRCADDVHDHLTKAHLH